MWQYRGSAPSWTNYGDLLIYGNTAMNHLASVKYREKNVNVNRYLDFKVTSSSVLFIVSKTHIYLINSDIKKTHILPL